MTLPMATSPGKKTGSRPRDKRLPDRYPEARLSDNRGCPPLLEAAPQFLLTRLGGGVDRHLKHSRRRRANTRVPKNEKIPIFESEDQEREFWATHDSVDYLDWSKARRVTMYKLKPSTKTISIRLPESLLEELKLLANKRDVPYQSLLKMFLAERLEQERRSR